MKPSDFNVDDFYVEWGFSFGEYISLFRIIEVGSGGLRVRDKFTVSVSYRDMQNHATYVNITSLAKNKDFFEL